MATTTRKELPARSSRGARIHQLIGEEAEADDSFWGQDAWREDEDDADYSTEAEEEDVVDSDFDEQENPDEDVHDQDEEDDSRRQRAAKASQRGAYREPKLAARNLLKQPRLTVSAASSAADQAPPQGQPQDGESSTAATPTTPSAIFQYEAPMVRRSTARKSSESSELRKKLTRRLSSDAKAASSSTAASAVGATAKHQRLTQAQLLAEAVRTEVENIQSLSRLEQLEEEKKAESITPTAPFTGHMVRFHSKLGAPKTITFLNSVEFPALFSQQKPKKRERPHDDEQQQQQLDGEDNEDEDEPQQDNGEDQAPETTRH